jgi:hypothetical protein
VAPAPDRWVSGITRRLGDLALDAGFLAGLTYLGLGDGLATIDRSLGERAVVVVGVADQQNVADVVGHYDVDGGTRLWRKPTTKRSLDWRFPF